MTVKECGWIHMHCENNQEIMDTVVMAYRVAEHHDVMLPVNVCYDGNFLSFAAEPVEIVDQKIVDKFLGKKDVNWHVALDPERPMGVDPLTGLTPVGGKLFTRYRQGHCKGMQNALKVITDVHAEWKKATGHDFAPIIEEYRMNKAEYAIMTIGSMTGAGKDAVDIARDQGKKVGLIKVKTFRPFPVKALAKAISKVKAVSVVDRSVNYGWNCGPLCQEVFAVMPFVDKKVPIISHIGGLAGTDLTTDHMAVAIENAAKAAKGKVPKETIWFT
jgi:pyruvate ferredoxin oxidoreductase alpha subunit/phenylglyoxylate dehydrogenase alpha subunit